MRRPMNSWALFLAFAAFTGMVIAGVIWLYLKIANLGITLIWDMIPKYIDFKYYTLVMCLIGGVIVGVFHKYYGPYPESMADSIKRVKVTGSYPYKHLPITVMAAFLSLFFGGSVGPESGLVCLLLGCCFWAMDQFSMARERMEMYLAHNRYISRGYVFKQMLKGIITPFHKIVYEKGKVDWTKFQIGSAGAVAGIVGLIVYEVLNALLGRGLSIPHLAESDMYARDRVGIVLLMLAGVGAGYLYLIFKRLTTDFFAKLRDRNLDVLNAVLGGLVLGVIGTFLPMTMFSGGNDIQAIQYDYLQYTPYLLILIGVVKLFLTNVCIESGWRGGHFFPLIFSAISIGYGLSSILDINQMFSVVVVTAALLGTVMQQPIGALVLTAIFLPIQEVGWMILAAGVAGCIPQPAILRLDPTNRGFIYNITHRDPNQKRLVDKLMEERL